MSVVLGLNSFHADSSAALIVDGKVVAAIAEERLGQRQKHTAVFPFSAIARVLDLGSCDIGDVEIIAVPRDGNANVFAKMLWGLKNLSKSSGAAREFFSRNAKTKGIVQRIADEFGSNVTPRLVCVEHHLAHVASSYYCSDFDELCAGLTYDASGDFVSLMAAKCEGNRIQILDRVYLPHSLGFFYTAVCQLIGFRGFGEEFKMMGLAAYGEDAFEAEMRSMITTVDQSWFRLNPDFFEMHAGGRSGGMTADGRIIMAPIFSERVYPLFGLSKRSTISDDVKKNLAASAQAQFQRVVLHCGKRVLDLCKTKNLVTAGGCALNGLANAELVSGLDLSGHFIHPAASDDGGAVGAALWADFNFGKGAVRHTLKHCYLGGSFTNYDIEQLLLHPDYANLDVELVSSESQLLNFVAKQISLSNVIGWFQGRSEWGPRALGNRSILANPLDPNMKQILNEKIKRRESFRPFAPSIKAELASKYFESSCESPFMMHVLRFKAAYRTRFPAVTHVDGTGRVQTVSEESNSRYYKLLSAFEAITGHGMLLNTSFNENEPIVETPMQALSCFLRTDMDVLVLNDFVVMKK